MEPKTTKNEKIADNISGSSWKHYDYVSFDSDLGGVFIGAVGESFDGVMDWVVNHEKLYYPWIDADKHNSPYNKGLEYWMNIYRGRMCGKLRD